MNETSPYDTYLSPLATRNASPEMLRIWSPRHKFSLWRKIWLAVAEAQHELGLPVSAEQVAELRANLEVTDEDIRLAEKYERELRHDVMSHVHAWGDRCPKARGIIHLGMTSQDINDNAELLLLFDATRLITTKMERVLVALGGQAAAHAAIPTLAFTHYQAAQPVTVGRRFAHWASDLHETLVGVVGDDPSDMPRLRGFRGATGTQASYLQLFSGDSAQVLAFEARAIWNLLEHLGHEEGTYDDHAGAMQEAAAMLGSMGEDLMDDLDAEDREQARLRLREGFAGMGSHEGYLRMRTFDVMGQTYPRVYDAMLLSKLAAVAAVLHKIATDIRLLSNRKEIDEPVGDKQIGSSAMPYKQNPMRCERICGLSRFVMNLVGNAYDTAATQWLERTLDDSSNRRLSLPEAFLALDGALDLMHNVASGLVVHEATVRKNLMAELPFMATENIMMEAVKLGRDRQDVHEAIRRHSRAAGFRVKQEGAENDLIERLKGEPLLEGVDIDAHLDPMLYVGRSVEQTERFLKEVIEPLRERCGDAGRASEPKV